MADWHREKVSEDKARLRAMLVKFHRVTRRANAWEEDSEFAAIPTPPELFPGEPARGLMRSCLTLSMRGQMLQAIHGADGAARAEALAKAFSAYMLIRGRAPATARATADLALMPEEPVTGERGVRSESQRGRKRRSAGK